MAVNVLPCFICWLVFILSFLVFLALIGCCVYQIYQNIKKAPGKVKTKERQAKLEGENQVELVQQDASLYGDLDYDEGNQASGKYVSRLGGKYKNSLFRENCGDTILLIPTGFNFVSNSNGYSKNRMTSFFGNPFRILGVIFPFLWMVFLIQGSNAAPGDIDITNVQTQLPCANIPGLQCRPDDQYYHELTATVELPFEESTVFNDKWLIVPFMRLDNNPGLNICKPGLIQQCLIVNNAEAFIHIEVGSFRWSHMVYESPSLEMPYDYILEYTRFNGTADTNMTECTMEPSNTEDLYSDSSVCVAAVCNCNTTLQNSSITEVFPLLPACGLFPVKHNFPRPSTWINVTIWDPVVKSFDTVFIPHVTKGMTTLSKLGKFLFQVDDFYVPGYPQTQYPIHLDGGVVVCNWIEQFDLGGELNFQNVNPRVDPMDQNWYYVNSNLISQEYRGHECGQNGISSEDIYGFPAPLPFCCNNLSNPETTDYTQGACVPDRPPEFIISNKSPDGFPPFSFPGSDNYWLTNSGGRKYQLLREPSEEEFPESIGYPKLDFKVSASDKLILSKNLGKVILVASGSLLNTICNFEYNINLGSISFQICNEALHVAIPANTSVLAKCYESTSSPILHKDGKYVLYEAIEPGLCRSGAITFSFDQMPFNLSQISNVYNPFDMQCALELYFPIIGLDIDVNITFQRTESINCSLLAAQFAPIINNTNDICENEIDISCLIHRGQVTTTGNPWGIVVITAGSILLAGFIAAVIALIVEYENHKKSIQETGKKTAIAIEKSETNKSTKQSTIYDR